MTTTYLLVKLQPNQDVTQALETVARENGFRMARILASVGSLVESVVDREGERVRVSGPGQEIAGLSGTIDPAGGSSLSGYVCCMDSTVIPGTFAYGLNAVGVTFEVLMEGET
jgi:predicted DNA-binding protein with PD1-like motif